MGWLSFQYLGELFRDDEQREAELENFYQCFRVTNSPLNGFPGNAAGGLTRAL
jgi:hypothetical protein